jgi:YVTN family beta-propeller protein
MTPLPKTRLVLATAALLALMTPASLFAQKDLAKKDADDDDAPVKAQTLPNTGQTITPLAPKSATFETLNPGLADNPNYVAGQAGTTVTSPDHKTLLVLTSGYNLMNYTSGAQIGQQNNPDSNEYIFVYDIGKPQPVKTQVIQVPNTYFGIVFDPSGTTFYVSGGSDDNVHIYSLAGGLWAEQAGSPIALGHTGANGLAVGPEAAGIAVTADGTKLVVADYYNDSISILSRASKASTTWTKTGELDLRPGKLDASKHGVPGGEYPFWVSIVGNNTAYVSSLRERELVVVGISGAPTVSTRIKLKGQPNKMTLNADQSRLYVAEDETDSVAVINTGTNTVLDDIAVTAPYGLLPASREKFKGNNTNSVTLSPDESTLYITNGNENDVAMVHLGGVGLSRVEGLIPTGWYPNSVSLSGDGKYMYVVNGKSPTGPNPGNCKGLTDALANACAGTNGYNLQLVKAGFQSFPVPTPGELNKLTELVADNDHFQRYVSEADREKMEELREKIKHVIYIIKENRTYDQVLGDLPVGNGDPSLVEFGKDVTPNQHRLARKFVTLDNFYDSSEVSMDGWPWSTSARAPDVVEKQTAVNYAGRGLSYDSEGSNRNVNVGYGSLAARLGANPLTGPDPDLLPGNVDTAAPDSPSGEINKGYIWDAALKQGLSVRNYGFFIDLVRYQLPSSLAAYSLPELLDPSATKTTIAYSTNTALQPLTDPYFRGFDQIFPDYYRFLEFKRDMDVNGLSQLTLVRLAHDHTGSFGTAILGVNTPELQVADNDYAVGLVAETIAKSQYKDDTLIFVIEDDSQDGADHVDSHRSTAYVVGPYVKQHAVVSKAYNTVNLVRTMEDILGIGQLNLNDSVAVPMADVFDLHEKDWSFTAHPSEMLYSTQLPLPVQTVSNKKFALPTHDAAYWAAVTKGMDFSEEDKLDGKVYNQILWTGLKGGTYPEFAPGADLRKNRAEMLARYYRTHPKMPTVAATATQAVGSGQE